MNALRASFVLLLAALAARPVAGAPARKLEPGKPAAGTLAWPDGPDQIFRIKILPAVHLLRLELEGGAADLDLYASCTRGGEIPSSHDDYDHADNRTSGRGELILSRDGEPPLEDGVCVVAVVAGEGPPPVSLRGGERRMVVKYRLTAAVVVPAVDASLAPGVPIHDALSRAQGYVRTYRVEPPATGALRVDVDGEADVDLYAGVGAPPRSTYSARLAAHSALARESILVDDARTLRGAPLFVRVYLPGGGDGEDESVPFTLYATHGAEPPAPLAALPLAPRPNGPLGEAQRTTVEVCRGDLCGSGVLVSPQGHFLTAQHVLDSGDGVRPGDWATAGWTQDPGKPPVHTFRAEVLAVDEKQDVALLQIRAGFYGQPLPADYVFPSAPRGDVASLGLGAPLVVAGYPITGGAGSLPTLTVSLGVVAGFQRRAGGTLIKTDAVVHEGNSGGPAFDSQWKLVGLAVFNVGESEGTGQIGYLVGVDALPAAWLPMLHAGAK